MSFNRAILAGAVTRDVELRHVGANKSAVAEIGLAVSDRVKRGNQWVEETTFIDCTAWARTAEIAAEYLRKGDAVLIEGRLKLDQWEANGQKRSKLKVVVDRLEFIQRDRAKNQNSESDKPGEREPADADLDTSTAIPF